MIPPRPAASAALVAGWVLAGALGGPPPAAASPDDGLPGRLARVEVGTLVRLGKARLRHSACDVGRAEDAFDGRPATAMRTRAVNPAFLEVTLADPVAVSRAQVFLAGEGPHEWSLLAGEDPERLEVVVRQHRVSGGTWSDDERFRVPVRARIFRVVVLRRDGDPRVEIGEVALWAEQRPVAIRWDVDGDVVTKGGELPLRAVVEFDGGHRTYSLAGLEIFSASPRVAWVFRGAHSDGRAGPVAHYVGPGEARIEARLRGRPGVELRAPPLLLRATERGLPDLDVTFIERTPRIDFDARDGGRPRQGDAVVWVAHVRNTGTSDGVRVRCAWLVDGAPASDGSVDAIDRFGEGTSTLRLPWDGARHEVRFVVDPAGEAEELSRANNDLAVVSDALLLGVWVERSVARRFAATFPGPGDGAAGFEARIQRQVARWNGMLRDAVHPLTPRGVSDRLAVDRIVIVDDGALPLSGGDPVADPDASDLTVDMMVGFPATLLDGDAPRDGAGGAAPDPPWLGRDLLRDLCRARYLVDLRRLDVAADEVRIADGEGGAPALAVAEDGTVHRTTAGGIMAGETEGGLDAHSAAALQRIAGRRARAGNRNPPPDRGEYLGDLPATCGIRVLAADGRPLDGAEVAAWRRSPRDGGAEAFHEAPVRTGETRDGGTLDLSVGGDPFFDGARGALDEGRGVLLLRIRAGGRTCWRFLEVIPFNLARWAGSTRAHYEDVRTDLP